MARRFTRLSASEAGKAPRVKFTLDKLMTDLETAFGAVDDSVAALAAAVAAQADATTALANAATAQAAADTVKRDDAISASWTTPGLILTAADAGSDATITIAAHTRKYADATSVSVNGGSLTAQPYSTLVYVYYDQTSRAGGAVTYHATTNANTAQYNAAAGRHYCGSVTTPAMGGGSTSGGGYPGGGHTNPNEF